MLPPPRVLLHHRDLVCIDTARQLYDSVGGGTGGGAAPGGGAVASPSILMAPNETSTPSSAFMTGSGTACKVGGGGAALGAGARGTRDGAACCCGALGSLIVTCAPVEE
eukprot:CAMPEP_0198118704 /NCGR_PEP_ID=MMETSP1442-20131203/22769_1 /TAXON_ID= /ORGANISM="Craspedostauros australis, Strain CCMP3328" /LENGTH=108 /DNA_ID=CAMNT_0043777013 /DNA_START=231 /DNA_END=557 /DNA_ORIENTATION=-